MNRSPFEHKLLVCDMDGTTLDSKSLVSRENREALKRFTEGGGLFTVATGRMVRTVIPYLEDLPVNVPGIVYNGAGIYDFQKNKMLWQNCLPESVYDIGVKIIEQFPEAGLQVYSGSNVYYVRRNEETFEHMLRENIEPGLCELNEVPRPWLKMLAAWKHNRLLEVKEFLDGIGGEKPYRTTFSEPQFLEFLNPDVSKGSALKKLTSFLDGACDFVVGIGDNLNDIELIQEATFGIAVGNAHEALKGIADRCCCTNDDHAIAEVIGWIEDGTLGA